ncbi:polysaccharide deacetylase family protein [Paenibacillus ferrarius]|uniref:polysaccharide deacetylase family protein n=1 Tax=Paenibacillus ferrarius TaxID=1469647 RepID=UPI003D2CDA03
MVKQLWFVAASCLLMSGCGVSSSQPFQDQGSSTSSFPPAQDVAIQSARSKLADDVPPSTTMPQTLVVTPAPQSVATPAATIPPRPTPTPVPKASVQPKANTKRTAQTSESAKRPSVPVQKNQGHARIQKKLTLSQLVAKYPDTFKLRGSGLEKKIALTFDDGPDTRFTPKVLDVLKSHQVKATFFVLGSLANTHPDVIKRIAQEGHVIGNHSFSHANLPKLSVNQFQNQIVHTENVLQGLIGYAPKLVRPPYGAINEEQVRWIADHHYLIVNWNVDSLDWKSLSAAQVLQNVLHQTRPGSIILQHSGGAESQDLSGTVQALSPLITKLKAAGYTFVTVPELLHVEKSK